MSDSSQKKMHTLLAGDTSTRCCTIALCEGEAGDVAGGVRPGGIRILTELVMDQHRLHAERLLSAVDWVLASAGKTLAEVDYLALTVGPGSFTGLRIGAAAWKGLAYAQGLPLIGVSTLDAMVRQAVYHDAWVIPMLDARMNEVFGALYRFDERGTGVKRSKDQVLSVEALLAQCPDDGRPIYVLGDGAARYEEDIRRLSPRVIFAPVLLGLPRAAAVAAEALALLPQDPEMRPEHINPVYLRLSQAEMVRAAREGSLSGGTTKEG